MNARRIPNAARQRLEDAKALRRSQTRAAARNKSGASLSARFLISADRWTQEVFLPEEVSDEVRANLVQVLLDTGVTAENVKNRKSAAHLWRDHLDPLYNTLRGYISKSKEGVEVEKVVEFWHMVAAELQLLLHEIATAAEVSDQALGSPMHVFDSELSRNS